MIQKFILFCIFLTIVYCELTPQQKAWIAKSSKTQKNGWTHIKIGGEPLERGFQHGYLLAEEYKAAIRTYTKLTYFKYGKTYKFFVDSAVKINGPHVPKELQEEMVGIANGLTAAGVPTTVEDIIGWNAYMEMTGYWWPTVKEKYGASNPSQPGVFSKSHCSAFVATGSATKDGKVVLGHESFIEFWMGQYFNIIVDLTPTNGSRLVFQASPCYISSMTDYYVTSAGLIVTETTIVGYQGYNPDKTPEWVRIREATQYAKSLDEWVKIMNTGNNGGYANSWLLADIHTNEIASFEQGLIYQNYTKLNDGYIVGDNAPTDPRIRNLECTDVGFNDIRQQTGARRTRWPALVAEHYGKIDYEAGQVMLADTYDVYLRKENPCSRTICAHYDIDPQYYVSDPHAVWNVPYTPAGSIDGKVSSYELAKNMTLSARFGRADGVAFDAAAFLKLNPQWNWQEGYLTSRPSQPWTIFD